MDLFPILNGLEETVPPIYSTNWVLSKFKSVVLLEMPVPFMEDHLPPYLEKNMNMNGV